jgi:hypothetical protein
MEYKLKLPAIAGDIVPLSTVASAMAHRDATAGGTPFNKPTFDGRLTQYILALLEDVRSGRLAVCNGVGAPMDVDPNTGATDHFGYAEKYVTEPDWEKLRLENPPIGNGVLGPVYDFSHNDFGPKEIDKTKPIILWLTKLKALNEWAETRGDSFTILHDGGWIDDRGFVLPTEVEQQKKVRPKANLKRKADPATTQRNTVVDRSENWRPNAYRICVELRREYPHLSQDQISDKAHAKMREYHAAAKLGMTGRGGRVPSAGSIRRQAFKKLSSS